MQNELRITYNKVHRIVKILTFATFWSGIKFWAIKRKLPPRIITNLSRRAFYLRRANRMLSSSSPKIPNYLAPYPLFALFLLFFVVLLGDVVVIVAADVVVPISFPTSATISLSIAS